MKNKDILDEEVTVRLTVQDIFFIRRALRARIEQYEELLRKTRSQRYSSEKAEREEGLTFFLCGFRFALKALPIDMEAKVIEQLKADGKGKYIRS